MEALSFPDEQVNADTVNVLPLTIEYTRILFAVLFFEFETEHDSNPTIDMVLNFLLSSTHDFLYTDG